VEEVLTTHVGVILSVWLMVTAAVIWRSSVCLMMRKLTKKLLAPHLNHHVHHCNVCLAAVLEGVVEGLIMTAGVTRRAFTTTMLTVAVT